jgi:CubicO group peptidase (beta-lactamase class C family)
VLKPAGLEHTGYETESTVRAQGYRKNQESLAIAGPISMTQPFAAGALVSTAGDLVRWQRALVNGKLVPADVFERITSDVVETGREGERYGYGIGVSERNGRRVISHGGGINGFASLLAYFPESDHTIVILANTEGFNTGALLAQITRTLFEEK